MAPAEICNPPVPIMATVWHAFGNAVKRKPQYNAYTMCYQPADHLQELRCEPHAPRAGHLNWNFADLEYATVRLAAGMLDRGVKRGSTIVTFLLNGIERELCLWVSVALQLTLLPCDPALLLPGREEQLEHFLTSVTPEVIVLSNDQAAAAWEERTTEDDSFKICLEPISRPGWLHFSALPHPQREYNEEWNIIDQQDPCCGACRLAHRDSPLDGPRSCRHQCDPRKAGVDRL